MAKKTSSGGHKAKGSKGQKTGIPDVSVLARYSPTDSANAHPDWVKTRFPTYVSGHSGHESTGIREFAHAGHVVRIVTSYRVEVDGRPVRAHLSVDEDGRVYTHATPFVTYGSAVDLMKAVINSYPDSFSEDHDGHDGHGDHGHHHGGGG